VAKGGLRAAFRLMAAEPVDPTSFTFSMEKRVRWSEVDPQGIVFNPNYLVFADIAFTEYMRAIGLAFPNPFEAEGTEIFAVRSEVNFRVSARFDDELTLLARTARLGRSSFTVEMAVRRAEALLADIRTVYVNADPASSTSRPLPPALIDKVLAFERHAPERA